MIVIMTVIRSFGNAECYDDSYHKSHHPYHLHDDCHHSHRLHHCHHDCHHQLSSSSSLSSILLSFFYTSVYISNVGLGILGNAEDATMIVIMTVMCSFGNAEGATMIVIIRVIILIIFMMIVIIVIAFISVIMSVIIIIISFFYLSSIYISPGSKFDQGENLTFHPKETKETKTKGAVFFARKGFACLWETLAKHRVYAGFRPCG